MRYLTLLTGFFFVAAGSGTGGEKKTTPGKPEEAPAPRPLPNLMPGPGGWQVDPKAGEWRDPEGTRWKFDGLRWRVYWIDNKWYPVIPPGPVPGDWRREDLGQGWSEVLPYNSSIWHIIPPATFFMPPPFVLPPPPPILGPGAGPNRPQRLFRRRWQ